jgi:transcriptional regulator with XRE-family HTH domain
MISLSLPRKRGADLPRALNEIPHGEEVVWQVGRKLRDERKRAGLSLEEAARRARLSPDHLLEMEEGYVRDQKRAIRGPTLAKLERVAMFMAFAWSWFSRKSNRGACGSRLHPRQK